MSKIKYFPKKNKNLLPLLAITVLFLSVALVNYYGVFSPKSSDTKTVLGVSAQNESKTK